MYKASKLTFYIIMRNRQLGLSPSAGVFTGSDYWKANKVFLSARQAVLATPTGQMAHGSTKNQVA